MLRVFIVLYKIIDLSYIVYKLNISLANAQLIRGITFFYKLAYQRKHLIYLKHECFTWVENLYKVV